MPEPVIAIDTLPVLQFHRDQRDRYDDDSINRWRSFSTDDTRGFMSVPAVSRVELEFWVYVMDALPLVFLLQWYCINFKVAWYGSLETCIAIASSPLLLRSYCNKTTLPIVCNEYKGPCSVYLNHKIWQLLFLSVRLHLFIVPIIVCLPLRNALMIMVIHKRALSENTI